MIQLVEKDENTTRTYVQQLKQRCDEKDRKVDATTETKPLLNTL